MKPSELTSLDSMRSQTTLLLKYSMGVHLIPSWTYSSCRPARACPPAQARTLPQPAHLLRLQRQLDEDLLQLLVDKVDAELLEPISLQENKENLVSERITGLTGPPGFFLLQQLMERAQKNPGLLVGLSEKHQHACVVRVHHNCT